MGTAKKLKDATLKSKTFTVIGTPHYMAPEIISGKGYSYMVDLWSIGICLYEFMSGTVPFGDKSEDPYEIYNEIVKNPIKYPKHLKSESSKLFIE